MAAVETGKEFHPELSHRAPLHWAARDAPLRDAGEHPANTWRERSERHHARLGVHELKKAGEAVKDSEKPVGNAAAASDTAPLPLSLAEPPEATEDDADGDFWGTAMRMEIQRYVTYRTEVLHRRAVVEPARMSDFELIVGSDVNAIVHEMVSYERSAWRRDVRSEVWPDTSRPSSSLSPDEVTDLQARLNDWIAKLEVAGNGEMHAVCKLLPLDVHIRHIIADALMAMGESELAKRTLFEAIIIGESASQNTIMPYVVGWDTAIACCYTKAQQCARFARLAVIDEDFSQARRHCLDALKLYGAELDALPKEVTPDAPRTAEWRLILQCACLGVRVLLAAVRFGEGRLKEAKAAVEEALKEAAAIQNDSGASPQLKRMVAHEHKILVEQLHAL
jgi:hypothetical protein